MWAYRLKIFFFFSSRVMHVMVSFFSDNAMNHEEQKDYLVKERWTIFFFCIKWRNTDDVIKWVLTTTCYFSRTNWVFKPKSIPNSNLNNERYWFNATSCYSFVIELSVKYTHINNSNWCYRYLQEPKKVDDSKYPIKVIRKAMAIKLKSLMCWKLVYC